MYQGDVRLLLCHHPKTKALVRHGQRCLFFCKTLALV
jgi:hypothetical protein